MPLPQDAIDHLFDRYQNVYGQAEDDRRGSSDAPTPHDERAEMPAATPQAVLDAYEVWFVTGSQTLYGEETLRQVAEQSQEVAAHLAGGSRCAIVWKPVLTDTDSIRRLALDANARDEVIGVIAWMHTFSPAKMWIAGLDALRKPLLHLHTQANVELPWADIDFDFMNLNQAAHGDREFGYIQTRLGHRPQDRRRSRVQPRGAWRRSTTGSAPRPGWAARASLKLARFGDNMRYVAVTEGDKTEAELRFGVQVNTWGVNELVDSVDGGAPDAASTRSSRSTPTSTTSRPSCCPAATGTSRCATAPRSSSGSRSFLEAGGFARVHHELRGPRRAAPAARARRAAADGRRLRLRRRGRLEDRDPRAGRQRHGCRAARRREPDGGLHLRPRARPRRRSSAPTCSRSPRR